MRVAILFPMINDEILLALPDDPEEAFGVLYQQLLAKLAQDEYEYQQAQFSAFNAHEAREDIIITLFAFTDAHGIDIELSRDVPSSTDKFMLYFREVANITRYHITKASVKRAARTKSSTSGTYLLPPAVKVEIRFYLDQIREIISQSELSDMKRTALTMKLNAFATEVDRDKTRLEALASAIVWTRKEITEGAKGLEPLVEKLEKMFNTFAKATEFMRLPSPSEKKELPAPQKRIEDKRDVDEEVTFQ